MVATVCSLTGAAAVVPYLCDAFTPMKMMAGRTMYVIGNWIGISMSVIAIAATITAFITVNFPIIFLGIALFGCSVMASYSIKQLGLKTSIQEDTAALDKIGDKLKEAAQKDRENMVMLNKHLEESNKQLNELKEEKQAWQKQSDVLREQVAELQKIPDSLQEKLNSFSSDVSNYAENAQQSGIDIVKLQAIATSLNQNGKDIQSLTGVIDQLQKLFNTIIQQTSTANKENETLNAQLQALHQANLSLHNSLQQEGNIQEDTHKQIAGVYDLIKQAEGAINGRSS